MNPSVRIFRRLFHPFFRRAWLHALPAALCLLFAGGCMDPETQEQPKPDEDLAVGFSTVPTGFTDLQVAGGLSNPTQMEITPDGRVFVSEQGGKLRVIKN